MPKETSPQSGTVGAPPAEAEYDAVYAAVTATERGRWFLAEFANRTRQADTDVILAAISRVEAALRAGAVPQAEMQPAPQVPAIADLPPERAGERDEPGVEDRTASVIASDSLVADTDYEGVANAQALSDQDYSDAVAAIAVSLTTRLEESAKNSVKEMETVPEPAAIPAAADVAKPAGETVPRARVPQDNSPRWHIESPDFVFGAADLDEAGGSALPLREAAQLQAQLLGAEIMSAEEENDSAQIIAQPIDVGAAAGEEPLQQVTAGNTVFDTPPPVAAEATAPAPIAPAGVEIVPLAEMARPQLRVAREAVPSQRPPRYGSLTVTDALSEDEVIALFG